MDTPTTTPSGRPGSALILGGAAGFVALIAYAIVTRPRRTDTESMILVGLLFLFVVAISVGILRRVHFSPKYPYKIVWQVQLMVWTAAFIAPIAIDTVLYRYFGSHHWARSFWGRELVYVPIYGVCALLAWKFGLKPKIIDAGDRSPRASAP